MQTPVVEMTDHEDAEAIIAEFGTRPYDFVTILHKSNNRNSQTSHVNARWKPTFENHPPSDIDAAAGRIWGMTDNGDFLIELQDGSQAILDCRSDSVLLFSGRPIDLIRRLKQLLPDVFNLPGDV